MRSRYFQNPQHLIILAIALLAVGMTVVVHRSDPLIFPRFIGSIHPYLAVPLVSALGVGLLSLLLSLGWFAICRTEPRGRLWWSPTLGALFAVVTVALDLKVQFPADLNVRFPASLLFYPAIGFVVEVVFHLLPLTVLLALAALWGPIDHRRTVLACILVALLEPLFQTLPMAASAHYPAWAVAFVGLHLFLFNLFQLWLFRRYDFITMYLTRLGYYLVWHVIWGKLRLAILF